MKLPLFTLSSAKSTLSSLLPLNGKPCLVKNSTAEQPGTKFLYFVALALLAVLGVNYQLEYHCF